MLRASISKGFDGGALVLSCSLVSTTPHHACTIVIFLVMQVRMYESINFKEFTKLLSPFSPCAPKDAKLEYLFQVYDVDGDGEREKACVGRAEGFKSSATLKSSDERRAQKQ